MLVKDCMSHRLESVDGSDSVQAAAERMRVLDVGCLPVFESGRMIGIVTDRDLVVRALARGVGASLPVRNVMSREVVTCFAEEDVRTAAGAMARDCVRRLVVIDRDQQPVGILSADDLALQGCDPDIVASVLARAVTRRDLELNGILR